MTTPNCETSSSAQTILTNQNYFPPEQICKTKLNLPSCPGTKWKKQKITYQCKVAISLYRTE